ncbi:hypothetical protein COLO4_10969 [Corchorus olitorius]|uniref:Uncharacterized protein n=1 Tax=Corchorus olitorius TaxID=93759 RepID=A0A1R3K697_9ROSI|nr:hypothetical protein COLO4_10969 [Corchorus olitorius]
MAPPNGKKKTTKQPEPNPGIKLKSVAQKPYVRNT